MWLFFLITFLIAFLIAKVATKFCRLSFLLSISLFVLFPFNAAIAKETPTTGNIKASLISIFESVNFQESDNNKTYNKETGTLLGAGFSYYYLTANWQFSANIVKTQGSLEYNGLTQLSNKANTETNFKRFSSEISLKHQLYTLPSFNEHTTNQIWAVIAIGFEQTDRKIKSKGIITGLNETYLIPNVHLGVTWQYNLNEQLSLQLHARRNQSINAQLDVDFLTTYDDRKIDLNAVYQNSLALAVQYQTITPLTWQISIAATDGEISKSDSYQLYIDGEPKGRFFQPKREFNSTTINAAVCYAF